MTVSDGQNPTSDYPDDSTRSFSQADDPLGNEIGPYKLLQVIGEGGFGVVYLAEQKQPIRRRVALKVIKLGMVSRSFKLNFNRRWQTRCETLGLLEQATKPQTAES